jgi:hypothetical protein
MRIFTAAASIPHFVPSCLRAFVPASPFVAAAALALACSAALAEDVSVTIYSSADPAGFDPREVMSQVRMQYNYPQQIIRTVPGFAVVRDTRELDLKEGRNSVAFADVAEYIDPTTVSLVDLSIPADQREAKGVRVLEQRFQFDLVSQQKLLEKYLDQEVTIPGVGSGKLLAAQPNSLTLLTAEGVRIVQLGQEQAQIQLGKLPEGLITRPTLRWDVTAPAAGKRQVQTAYQTDGITWRSDYNLVLSADEKSADLGAWVSILNLSGVTYADAQLKLIAGDVQRILPQPQQHQYRMMKTMLADARPNEEAGFQEKSFFEYHMYTLPRRTTVDQNSTQQIALFDTKRGVKVEKVYVYYGLPQEARYWTFASPNTDRNLGQQSNKKVDVYVQMMNTEENHLGVPLPKGKMRLYKADGGDKGTLEFIGEDLIDHTARNEKVLAKVGQAFDVTGERVQTDFKVDTSRKWAEESFTITLKNAKETPVKVLVRENLYRWHNWEITSKSGEFEKVDFRTIHFPVELPARSGDTSGSATVKYTVRYTW